MVKHMEKVSGFGFQVKEHGQCSGNCRQREREMYMYIYIYMYTYYTYTYTFYCIKNLLKWFSVCVCVRM